jgi:pyridoxamine 5'-phosphate oxidase-like protein
LSVILGTLFDMARWREIEQETPELAARVREAFGRAKHATMATLRADGSPRISGTEVEFTDDGNVRLGSMPGAVKARDLLRDPRLAVHSPTAEPGEGGADWPGEAKVAGTAVAQPDREDGAHLFDLDLTEVVWTGLNEARDTLVIRSWHPGRGVEARTRA